MEPAQSATAPKRMADLGQHHPSLLEGGDSGPAVVPGDPGDSLLIQAIRHQDGLAMPLRAAEALPRTSAFVKWVELGAPDWPSQRNRAPAASWPEDARRHWAFQLVRKVAPPAVKQCGWMQTQVTPSSWPCFRARLVPGPTGHAGRVAPPR